MNQNHTDKNQVTTRVDFTESPKSTWYGRYSWTDESEYVGALVLNGSLVDTGAQQLVVDNARVLTTSLVNETRFGYNRFFNHSGGELNNVHDAVAEVGLQPLDRCHLRPGDCRTLGSRDSRGLRDVAVPVRQSKSNWQFIDNLSWTRGTHFFSSARTFVTIVDQDGNQYARGAAAFANNIATGYAFADYLPATVELTYAAGLAQQAPVLSQAIANDTWKLTPKITLNAGLRYELTPPWSDGEQRTIVAQIPLNTQQPQVADLSMHPVLVRAGTGDFYQGSQIRFSPDIQVARDGRLGDNLIQTDYTNFAPRVGVAWNPSTNWVIRGWK